MKRKSMESGKNHSKKEKLKDSSKCTVIVIQIQPNIQFVWKIMSNTVETSAFYTSLKMDTLSKNMKILFSVSHKQMPN